MKSHRFILLFLCGSSLSAQDVTLSSESIKPDPSYGWTVHSFNSQVLLGLPDRNFSKFPLLASGIADLSGNLHLRGSRAGEVAYMVEGVSVTNPFFNSNGVPLIPEIIERMDIHTGAYGAQMGGGNGGVISSRMRRGGENLEFNVNAQADDFARPGKSFYGAPSTGHKRVVGTLGGTLFGASFFFGGEHKYLRNRQPMFLEPFRFDNLTADAFGYWPEGTPLPGPVEFKRNYLYNNWQEGNTLQGNIMLPIGPIDVQAFGSYALEEQSQGGEWPVALENYYRQARNMINESETLFGALRLSSSVLPTTQIAVTFSSYDRSARLYDPMFGDEWVLYSDSVAFREKGLLMPDGTTGFTDRFFGPPSYSTIYGFQFRHPNAPNNNYRKDRQTNYSLALDVSSDILPTWMLTAGGKVEWWTMREFNVTSISTSNIYMSNPSYIATADTLYEKRVMLLRSYGMEFYGYDYTGAEADDGFDVPREPQFWNLYFNNRITDDKLVLNFGARYESFFSGATMFDWNNTQGYDFDLNIFPENKATQRPSVGLFLPRINASYSRDDVAFFAAFGKYAQYAPLDYLLLSNVKLSGRISPYTRVGFWLNGALPGFFADPERSTQFELGGRFPLLPQVPLLVRVYYKTFTNQLQLGRVYNEQDAPQFVALLNAGEGTSKGIELSLELLRTDEFTILAHYAYSDAQGRTSHPFWNRLAVSDVVLPAVPQTLIPFDYDRTHRVVGLFDYRYDDITFEPLRELGITALLTVQSGHRYTKLQGFSGGFGSGTAWNIGVRPISDPRVATPEEPYNSSRTPLYVNLDLRASILFKVSGVRTEFFVTLLNIFNTKHVLNVFPTTGTPTGDSWFNSSVYSNFFASVPRYTEFYSTINLKNGWAYSQATGNLLYGEPMQIRAGITVGL
ncbi:MAG: TonB-dependent receptor [Ignavibacteriae bacterium]|nr:TonB-dependent receptor [Ignavibacteriota bacterium]